MNNLQTRVISALVMVTAFGAAVYVHHVGLLLTFALMVFLVSMEYVGMVKPGNRTVPPAILALVIYFGFYLISHSIELQYFLLFLKILCVFHVIVLIELLLIKSARSLRYFLPGILYLSLAASSIHYFQYFEFYRVDVFILLALVWASDTGSYFMGKFLGKTPLASNISPKKTVEGFIGGLLLGLAFSCVLILCNVIDWRLLLVAGIVHLLAVLGDLIESKVKRLTNIKDTSNLIPGHGGILDRCDGMLFALPFGILIYHQFFNI